jgi:hypothetical protein
MCPNLQCPWGIDFNESGKDGENCPICGTKLQNFRNSGDHSVYSLRERKKATEKTGAYALFKNVEAADVVNGVTKPREWNTRYIIIHDVSRSDSFRSLQKAINIFSQEGWQIISFQVSPHNKAGTTIYINAYIIMERAID